MELATELLNQLLELVDDSVQIAQETLHDLKETIEQLAEDTIDQTNFENIITDYTEKIIEEATTIGINDEEFMKYVDELKALPK